MLRSRKREASDSFTDDLEIPCRDSAVNVAEARHRLLWEAMADLDPALAQLVILRYVHNYSDAQMAKFLGSSRGAVAMRLFRARLRLKKLMRDLGEGQ
jgi:RNA polymerase sigma factor (sigma-70 family)